MQQEVDPAAAGPPVSPRRRFQYSLSTLMLLTTIAALLCAIFAMYRELKQARAEVRKYRGEMGYLEITDPKKIYARALRKAGEDRWSWRVYLPKNRQFGLNASTSLIPAKGLPGAMATSSLNSGEHFIDASAEEGRDGKWHLYVGVDGYYGCGQGIEMASLESQTALDVFEREQRAVPADEPMVLLRVQKGIEVSPGNFEPVPASGTSDGIMIWIEAEPGQN